MLEYSTPTLAPAEISGAAARGEPGNVALAASLCLDETLRLWLVRGQSRVRVKPVRCFPWSAPGELVSLRDEKDREELLVVSLSELDAESSRALAVALAGA